MKDDEIGGACGTCGGNPEEEEHSVLFNNSTRLGMREKLIRS